MYEASEPIITYDNIQDSALNLTKTNKALTELVMQKCKKVVDTSHDAERIVLMSAPAIDLIVLRLEDLGQKPRTPQAIDYESALLEAFDNADNELLTRCWNEMMIDGGWTFIQDGLSGPEYQPYAGERNGWLVKDMEKIAPTTAIENVMIEYVYTIDSWINRFTKTLYLNTTTQEWAKVFQVDIADKQAVADMTARIKKILMGE